MAYQSLYRRFRPRDFAGIIGQEHAVAALQNAVRDDRVGHAYLLSGPRGTGKTTSARVLAKALNCENLGADGEPCSTCDSCLAIEAGTSFDLHELDAASNNKVDDMRDLLARVALGTPGRTKVYLLDEVHMLTSGAENALLKTLEEPPDHVVFVLATTEPHKVVATIRSRTQHLELRLVGAERMVEHVRWVAAEAGLDIDDETVEYVVRAGGGSVRDTLSALEQAVSAGGVAGTDTSTDEIIDALAEGDGAGALVAVASASERGHDPRVIGETLIDALRDVFLEAMGAGSSQVSEAARDRAAEVAARMTPARITRALETIGAALIDMRQAADPRIDLEVALVRVTRPDTDTSVEALTQRVSDLEQRLADGVPQALTPSPAPAAAEPGTAPTSAPTDTVAPPAAEAPAAAEPTAAPAPPAPPRRRPADDARARLAAKPAAAEERAAEPPPQAETEPSREAPSEPPPEPTDMPAPVAAEPPPSTAATSGPTPTLAAIEAAWTPGVLDTLSKRARSRFAAGHWVALDGDAATLALPNEVHRRRCEELTGEVEEALAAALGTRVRLVLTADASAADGPPPDDTTPAAPEAPEEDTIDPAELVDASIDDGTVLDRVAKAFPGAELVDTDDSA